METVLLIKDAILALNACKNVITSIKNEDNMIGRTDLELMVINLNNTIKRLELSSIKVVGEETPKLERDYVELGKKVDEILANETPESFQKWLDEYRERHPDHFEDELTVPTPPLQVEITDLYEIAKDILPEQRQLTKIEADALQRTFLNSLSKEPKRINRTEPKVEITKEEIPLKKVFEFTEWYCKNNGKYTDDSIALHNGDYFKEFLRISGGEK